MNIVDVVEYVDISSVFIAWLVASDRIDFSNMKWKKFHLTNLPWLVGCIGYGTIGARTGSLSRPINRKKVGKSTYCQNETINWTYKKWTNNKMEKWQARKVLYLATSPPRPQGSKRGGRMREVLLFLWSGRLPCSPGEIKGSSKKTVF